MFNYILKQIQNTIKTRQYIMTIHAEEEMEDDNLSIIDLEYIILQGKILERQKDRLTAESKYRIRGVTKDGINAEIIGKISITGKFVIITVYTL